MFPSFVDGGYEWVWAEALMFASTGAGSDFLTFWAIRSSEYSGLLATLTV
jgi:hypothetical protein